MLYIAYRRLAGLSCKTWTTCLIDNAEISPPYEWKYRGIVIFPLLKPYYNHTQPSQSDCHIRNPQLEETMNLLYWKVFLHEFIRFYFRYPLDLCLYIYRAHISTPWVARFAVVIDRWRSLNIRLNVQSVKLVFGDAALDRKSIFQDVGVCWYRWSLGGKNWVPIHTVYWDVISVLANTMFCISRDDYNASNGRVESWLMRLWGFITITTHDCLRVLSILVKTINTSDTWMITV